MASSPLQQVASTALDVPGLSVCTSVRTSTDPRQGGVYDNVAMAAASPIHFHPMVNPALGGASFMMLSSRRWSAATSSATDPGYASAFTEDTDPSWVLVHASTGTKTVLNSGFSIPMATAADASVLVGAVSRGDTMLYVLRAVTNGEVVSAVVQHFHNNTAINVLNSLGEETLPAASNGSDEIVFTAGIQYSKATDPYLYVYGSGSVTGQLYMARKYWSRVGYLGIPTNPLDSDWEFFSSTGWHSDPTGAGPLVTFDGAMLVSHGPLSFANLTMPRTTSGKTSVYTLMATTHISGSTVTGQLYYSLSGRAWKPLGAPIALGTVGSSYLGGTVQLQGQLGANPAMVDAGSATAIPYLVSTKLTSGSTHQINVAWGLLQVPRFS